MSAKFISIGEYSIKASEIEAVRLKRVGDIGGEEMSQVVIFTKSAQGVFGVSVLPTIEAARESLRIMSEVPE